MRFDKREGFIFPFMVAMVTILTLLGWSYMSSTLQSKGIFKIFYYDDLARYLAESAQTEWRQKFSAKLKTDQKLKRFFKELGKDPNKSEGLINPPFTISDLPETRLIAEEVTGLKNAAKVHGTFSVHNIDRNLNEEGMTTKYNGEFQATGRLEMDIGVKIGNEFKFSRFISEFDVKHGCLKSSEMAQSRSDYVPDLQNDYALFVRNAHEEFYNMNGFSLNNSDIGLIVEQPKKLPSGKIFLGNKGNSKEERKENFVFLNISNDLKEMMPKAPGIKEIKSELSWMSAVSRLPIKTERIRREIEAGINRQLPDGMKESVSHRDMAGMGAKFNISLNFIPLSANIAGNKPKMDSTTTKLRNHYTNIANTDSKAMIPSSYQLINLSDSGNKKAQQTNINLAAPLNILGAKNKNHSLEVLGSVRQRFWQTATLNFHIDKKHDKELILYQTPDSINTLSPEMQEFYTKWIFPMQQNNKGYLYMSMPNTEYAFIKKPSKPVEVDNKVAWPTGIKGTGERGDSANVNSYQPYYSYMVRTYHFKDQAELMRTPIWDRINKIIYLNGTISCAGEITIPKGWKYSGRGVIYSYATISIAGDFLPLDKDKDHCTLYTDGGDIYIASPANIRASLIALNLFYSRNKPKLKCKVDFLGNQVNVMGNIIADDLSTIGFATGTKNLLTYDSKNLNRKQEELFFTYLGGQIRRRAMLYSIRRETIDE